MVRLIKLVLLFIFIAVGTAMNYDRSGRIMGGSEAAEGQFPHQVSLREVDTVYHCGASVISSRWALTAAFCTFKRKASNLIVDVGSTYRKNFTSYSVAQYIEHPEYDDNKLINDISLVQTNDEIIFGEFVKPIALIDRLITSGSLLVSGWGKTQPNGDTQDKLRYIETNVVPLADCERRMPGLTNPDTFCAFNAKSIGICYIDYGSPLILPGANGPWQVGVASFIVGGCGSGYPDGFTSVYYHRDWILQNTKA